MKFLLLSLQILKYFYLKKKMKAKSVHVVVLNYKPCGKKKKIQNT
jgi:hypothetical protein